VVAGLQARMHQEKGPDLPQVHIPRLGITAEEAKTLEDALKSNPDILTLRENLIDYYFEANIHSNDPALEERREEHILWLIEHHPESSLAGSPEAEIMPRLSSRTTDGYQRAKQLWLDQTARNPDNPAILRNAGFFMLLSDRDQARELLEKVLLLTPLDRIVSLRLAQSYQLERMERKSPADNDALAQKALAIRERGLQGAKPEERFEELGDLAAAAFEAGDIPKAEQYAKELIQTAPQHAGNWNYGNAVHKANIVLGRVALRRDDVTAAKQYLLAAGETPGSPQLDSFGPNMTLAKELLEKNEREVVLTYLASCSKFWEMGGKDLKKWTATIKSGGMPDFGANLLY